MTKSVGCSAAGSGQLKNKEKRPFYTKRFSIFEKRLRDEARGRAVVVVVVLDLVGVELDLVVVEVEVRRVVEDVIGIRIFALTRLCALKIEVYFYLLAQISYILSSLYFIWQQLN
ncbi:MAG TPA: hypothetical protein VJK08_00920 [Patescibacteria group bacterium]|nr:hypothetical protein [Patescibacteria group bacterium]